MNNDRNTDTCWTNTDFSPKWMELELEFKELMQDFATLKAKTLHNT
jgi:hypothetical protein